jgi:crotonobetainyl-CoA:carnitine CoA-transferase CaiB-like acyl-CoA transferase
VSGLLEGLRVLDLSVWRPGPYATQLLAELGAEVVKVEPPGGDPMRHYPELFASLNANKKGIVLDLKDPAGVARALELATEADVVVEGFRPGVVDRLGVGPGVVMAANPSVIYCSVSGYGQDGPLALAPGHDINYQALSGALAPEGGEPVRSSLPIADLAGGMAAAMAILAAAFRRQRTGEGERVDVAMADVLATWTGAVAPQAAGVEHQGGVPGYGTFPTKDDAYVALGVLTEDHFWRALCDTLGLDDAADLTFPERMAAYSRLDVALREAIAARALDELVAALQAVDVPASPVLGRAGMVAVEQFRVRDVVTSDPWLDPGTGYPVRFGVHPAARVRPPPGLDEHRGCGFSPR